MIKNFLLVFFLALTIFSCKNNSSQIAKGSAFDKDIVLNKEELLLDKKIAKLKKEFLEGLKSKSYSFFDHSFEENRSIIDTSKLFKFIQTMPKGSILHLHSKGLTNINWVIDELKKYPNCYVYTQSDNKNFLFGQLMIYNSINEVPAGFKNLASKLNSDPSFRNKLYDAQVFRRFKLDNNVAFWPEFEKRFKRIGNVTNYRPFFYAYHKKAFEDLLADNVKNVEIRYIFDPLFDRIQTYSNDITIADFNKIIKDIHKTNPDFKLQLIVTSLKFLDTNQVRKAYLEAFNLRKKYPELIGGFDLVAEEDAGHSVSYFDKVWSATDSLGARYKTDMPIFMHAGESNSMTNLNISETVNKLYNKRIGHGLNMVLFPEAMDIVKDKNMLVEVNPLSNQILGYVNNLQNHPARILMNNGIQCAISSDDPGVFGYEGLSYDFFMATIAWELNLKSIKKLVFNSVEYSALPKIDIQTATEILKRDWNNFVKSKSN